MSHDLSLAQSHAFHLARTLMVPVTLFRSAGEYEVPADEMEGLAEVIEMITQQTGVRFVAARV